MEWLVLLLPGGAGAYAVWRMRDLRETRRERTAALGVARTLASEDVTVFGEQLQRLGDAVEGHTLDATTRESYQRALDVYERATRETTRLRDPEEVGALVGLLDDGRHALACVDAALRSVQLPAHRTPCFFNPQHGPSVTEVMWTPRGRGTQRFAACAQCAARVSARERPDVRMVRVGALRVPYWEAGSVTLPLDYAYFHGGRTTGPLVSWVAETGLTGDWELGHYGDWRHYRRAQIGRIPD